ncbi:Uu.00g031990.m01.CDS01 [Anthostomella pinea]|uniref:Uu.00g031990.m01.CDS01 n=1 Tax=Anthostomella pinea TaxID=933095 RepID=A0AAI8V8L3_9PEZI|nr:Uu.00g031990.m01.CDS01 [Anthostomella pinea]
MFQILDGQREATAPARTLPSFERFLPSVKNNASRNRGTMKKQEIFTKRQLDEMDEQVDLSAPLYHPPRPYRKSKTATPREIIELLDSDDE